MADKPGLTSEAKNSGGVAPTAPDSAKTSRAFPRLNRQLIKANWLEPFALWAGWRLGLGVLAFVAGIFLPTVARKSTAPYTPEGLNRWIDRLLGVWTHWDGEWFLYVAQVGYRPGDVTSPFFPLYPILVRIVATLLGGNYLLAGVLISGVAGLAAFGLLYQLVRHDFGEEVGSKAALYLAVFPTSFFLAACYSESLFLALTLGAFLAARRYRNWWLAGLLVGLAALTRNLGILLLIPLGGEWLGQKREERREKKEEGKKFSIFNFQFFALCLVPCALFGSWLAFQWLALGDPLNFVSVQSSAVWNRRSALPWETVARAFELFVQERGPDGVLPPGYREDPNLFNFPFWLFTFGALLGAGYLGWRRRMPVSYLLYFGIAALLPLFSPAAKEPLLSYPRFVLVLFPAFIVLALAGQRWRIFHYTYLLSTVLLLAIFFARFANWYWVA